MKLCHEFKELATPWGPIKLEQRGPDNFTTAYGKEVKRNLTYADAAASIGTAIMHFLALEGKLDNRERGQR